MSTDALQCKWVQTDSVVEKGRVCSCSRAKYKVVREGNSHYHFITSCTITATSIIFSKVVGSVITVSTCCV